MHRLVTSGHPNHPIINRAGSLQNIATDQSRTELTREDLVCSLVAGNVHRLLLPLHAGAPKNRNRCGPLRNWGLLLGETRKSSPSKHCRSGRSRPCIFLMKASRGYVPQEQTKLTVIIPRRNSYSHALGWTLLSRCLTWLLLLLYYFYFFCIIPAGLLPVRRTVANAVKEC